jgi:flagellar hook-basal body complex protein FliE
MASVNGIGSVGGVGVPLRPAVVAPAPVVGGVSFKDELLRRIAEVERLQKASERATGEVRAGRSADATAALEAKARADEAFRVLSAVRDQVLVAIEEVKRAVP